MPQKEVERNGMCSGMLPELLISFGFILLGFTPILMVWVDDLIGNRWNSTCSFDLMFLALPVGLSLAARVAWVYTKQSKIH